MATCFLFTRQFDEDACLSVRLDQQGQVDAPLQRRSVAEIKALQQDAKTIVVMPTENSSLHEIELPWLGERKARAAIPYALEEHVAQPVTTLHFAFDRQHYQDGRYLVAVLDKHLLGNLIEKLDTLTIHFDLITLDWFALRADEGCITATGLLVHDHAFKGGLSVDLAELYLQQRPPSTTVFVCDDSEPSITSESYTAADSPSNIWIARRLLDTNPMNLCQGELQHGASKSTAKYWYQASAALAAIWLISSVAVQTLNLYFLNSKISHLDQQIAVIYREFFPQSQHVISPKFRISQLLKSAGAGGDSALWVLLDKLAHAFDASQFAIEQLRFQNQILSVSLTCKDFSALEKLQQRLQQDNVAVSQTRASTEKQQVVATLELSL